MRHKQSKELMEWNFDDQAPKYTNSDTWDNDENDRKEGLCATSSTGKLFLYRGNLNSNIFYHLQKSNCPILYHILGIKGLFSTLGFRINIQA